MDEGLFRYLFGCGPGDISDKVILTPFVPVERFSVPGMKKRDFKGRLYHGAVFFGEDSGYTVINCGIGAQPAGDCVVLLEGVPVGDIIYVGSCGGLNGAVIGDVILCYEAFDGTGYSNYAGERTDIKKVLREARSFGPSSGIMEHLSIVPGIRKGRIFTIGSLAAETPENVGVVSSEGFDGIDMEMAVIYNASGTSGIKTAGLLFVSDLPPGRPFWRKPDPEERKKREAAMALAIRTAVEYMLVGTSDAGLREHTGERRVAAGGRT